MKILRKPIKFIFQLVIMGALCVLSCPSFAQVGREVLTRGVRAGGHVLTPREVSKTLKARVNTSYKKALEVQRQYPDMFAAVEIGGPSKFMFPQLHKNPQLVYPDKPFLARRSKDLTNYFIANNNRHLIRVAPQLNALQEARQANIRNFQRSQVQITHPASQDMHWLAEKIPSITSYLLLGEYHGNPNTDEMVSQLLREIRLRQPDRKIILLTEFLYNDGIQQKWLAEQNIKTWATAIENDIFVAGLEPSFVRSEHFYEDGIFYENMRMKFTNPENGYTFRNGEHPWASLEGIRLRNESWLATIQEFRQKYPDALFVIYGGDFHMQRGIPFSLGNALKEEYPFIVSFLSENEKTWFDHATQNRLLATRVLAFGTKKLRELAGFDVQIRLPLQCSDPVCD